MATVHWPLQDANLSRDCHLRDVPFILTAEDDYPDPINEFIHERARGKVCALHGADDNLLLKPLGRSAVYKLANNLADLLTWAESEQAHPTLGVIAWQDLRAWHITDLYQNALLQGFWSAHFFRYREPSPLNPASVKQKISAILSCYIWMSKRESILEFDYEPKLQVIEGAKRESLLSYRREMRARVITSTPSPVRSFRKAPADLPLPSPEHLQAFFEAIPSPAHRLAAMQMFETGMRAEEVVENTLLPGMRHQRDVNSGRWYVHPSWPQGDYELAHSFTDDRMLGVLPTREAAWFEDGRKGYQCEYRILGKNKKIRRVNMPPVLLRRIWKYVDSNERELLVAKRSDCGGQDIAFAYLNRFGEKLSYHAIWEAFDRANQKVKGPVDLTPHLMRHAFACHFLEQGIAEQARTMGVEMRHLSPDIITQLGGTILLTIQNELGHSEFGTTRKYLQQLISGSVRLQATAAWNGYLDNFENADGW